MSESKERTSRVVFAIALALSLIPFGYVSARLAKQSEWLSVPRRMPFVKADGSRLPQSLSGPDECRLGDIRFSMLVDGDMVWIPCRSTKGGGLARMDLTNARVEYRWQFPNWRVGWTRGLLPAPNGDLATVVGVEGGLGAAVAGPDGWQIPPQKLATDERDRVLALAVHAGVLEIAMFRIDANHTPAWTSRIVTFAPNGVRTRSVEVCGEKCGGIHAAYFGADSRFHFLVTRELGTGAEDVSEDGSARPVKAKLTSSSEVDSTLTGAVESGPGSKYVLLPNGVLESRPASPWPRGSQLDSRAFARSGDRMSRSAVYEIDGARMRSDPPRLYVLSHDKDPKQGGSPGTPAWEDESLGLRLFEASTFELTEKTPKRPVARVHECNSLAHDGVLVKVGDDNIVFDPSGCYVRLDAQLKRKDAWGLFDHLRMRGSMYLEWNERSHALKLLLVLLTPLLVLGAWLARRRFPRVTTTLAVVIPAVAIWCSVGLADILR